MVKNLKIGSGWIYLSYIERPNINAILKLMSESRSKTFDIEDITTALHRCRTSVSHALWLLVSANILNIEQRGQARIFSLKQGWLNRIKEKTAPHTDKLE